MINKPTDVSGGSVVDGQQAELPNKQQILLDILRELEAEGAIEPGWTTNKRPRDIEDLCKFQHPPTQREKSIPIDNRWFHNAGGLEKIKALLRRELGAQNR